MITLAPRHSLLHSNHITFFQLLLELIFGRQVKYFPDQTIFFPVLCSSHHNPSMVGALLCVTVSSSLGLLHSSLLFHRWLSLIADSFSEVAGLFVVELHSIWHQSGHRANLIGLRFLSPRWLATLQQCHSRRIQKLSFLKIWNCVLMENSMRKNQRDAVSNHGPLKSTFYKLASPGFTKIYFSMNF